MSGTLSITESQLYATLRSFLLTCVPAGVEVVRGQDNRVAEPEGSDFIVMIPIMRSRIETNTTTYSDGYPNGPGTRADLQPTMVTVQLDVHGPNSADNSEVISTLFRSEVATSAFAASGYDIAPLYASDPRQLAFGNGEQQVEDRYVVDAVMQANMIVTTPQQFAGALKIGQTNVTATYHP
jgi:hypothetical protein